MEKYVAGLMFDFTKEMVVLVRKNRPEWQKGLLNAVGGKIEQDEQSLNAMQREFYEETGVWNSNWIPLVKLYRKGVYEVYFYMIISDDLYNAETMEDEEIILERVDEINYAECISNLKWLIPLALDKNIKKGNFIEVEDFYGY